MAYDKASDTLFKVANMAWNAQPEFSLNAAANWAFLHWKQPVDKTLSQMRFGQGAIGGTPTSALSWEIFASDVQGAVGASSGVSGTLTPASYTTGNPTGLSLALVGGNYYGVLIKNVHATPASNFFTLLEPISSAGQLGWGMKRSYDSGTTYDDCIVGIPPLQLGFSDSTRYGIASMRSNIGNQGSQVYATGGGLRLGYFGVQIRPEGRCWLHKAQFATRLVGTLGSAGTLSVKLFRNLTEIESVPASPGSISTSGMRATIGNFADPDPILLEPDSQYSIVLANSGGSSSHHWIALGSGQTIIVPNANGQCIPWDMHAVNVTAGSLSSWNRTNEQIYCELALSMALRA